jgi:hypothetical protein
MKNAIFWNVMPCSSCKKSDVLEVRITSIFREKGISELETTLPHWFFSPWRWRRYVPPKRRFLQELHSVTSQKTAFLNFYNRWFTEGNIQIILISCYEIVLHYIYNVKNQNVTHISVDSLADTSVWCEMCWWSTCLCPVAWLPFQRATWNLSPLLRTSLYAMECSEGQKRACTFVRWNVTCLQDRLIEIGSSRINK